MTGLRRNRLLKAVAATGALLLTACPRKTAIWIVGQEAPGRPVFEVGEEYRGRHTYLQMLIVSPCDGWDGTARSARWFIVGGSDAPVRRIVYGFIPSGFQATSYMGQKPVAQDVAPPLAAGCYIASTDGTGRVRFEVRRDGSVLETEDHSNH